MSAKVHIKSDPRNTNAPSHVTLSHTNDNATTNMFSRNRLRQYSLRMIVHGGDNNVPN